MLLQTLLGGFVQGCIYSLIALGFVLIYRATRQINFAQGDLLMLGAYLGMQLQVWGVSWSVALLLSLLLLFLWFTATARNTVSFAKRKPDLSNSTDVGIGLCSTFSCYHDLGSSTAFLSQVLMNSCCLRGKRW